VSIAGWDRNFAILDASIKAIAACVLCEVGDLFVVLQAIDIVADTGLKEKRIPIESAVVIE
jgi:hypothetical protein